MSLDHGILNVPLAKRGDIDAQLDAYKATAAKAAAAERKSVAKAHRTAKAAAKVALAELLANTDLIAAKAERIGTTPRDLADILTDWSKWQPARVLKAHGEWLSGTAPTK
ncbi:hypothetical protein [Massilia sp. CCM 8734]|uniref:hypothetical protein n=1 Tax=Massilia sp. CCM 8734 TaxID=2609283 RepID=UPI001420BF0A|nr:hypothetical protein [Massilia sp. CCM 8734]NHZ94619.1 hypothetical protein [Massilia sp. CCM 8734]